MKIQGTPKGPDHHAQGCVGDGHGEDVGQRQLEVSAITCGALAHDDARQDGHHGQNAGGKGQPNPR